LSTVYILGAGSSASFDRSYSGIRCPTAKNFFSVADTVLKSMPGNGLAGYKNIVSFLEKYFSLPISKVEKAGLDMQDVLTFLDLELEYSDSVEEMDLLTSARNEFMDLLTLIFNRVLVGPPCPYHTALASSLAEGDTIISFNYDLLMDSAMNKSPYWAPETGYGFNAATADAGIITPGLQSKTYLLKPHGSFNWMVCKNCGKVYVLSPDQSTITVQCSSFKTTEGKQTQHTMERLIIPPSIKKDVHGNILQQIWIKALEYLKIARRIVIIGYSLPATDFMVKRLLYRALSQNRYLKEFELVDRKNSRSSNPLMEKYRPILYGNNSVRVICDKKNIREYTGALNRLN